MIQPELKLATVSSNLLARVRLTDLHRCCVDDLWDVTLQVRSSQRFDEILCIVESSTPNNRSVGAARWCAWITICNSRPSKQKSHNSFQQRLRALKLGYSKSTAGEMRNVRPGVVRAVEGAVSCTGHSGKGPLWTVSQVVRQQRE